ncbi:hypothetical protein RRG08_061841, partial [Elysia crispata]
MTELSCYRPGVLVEPRFDGDYTHNTGKIKIFTILDYFIFMLSLLIPIIIGFYQGWRRHNSMDFAEYMLARRTSAHVYIPVYYKLKINSVYQYLELRFNRTVRTVGSCLFIIQMVLHIPIALYAPSLAFSK